MSSLYALKNICGKCERNNASRNILCPYRSLGNTYCTEYVIIEKELTILKILEKLFETDYRLGVRAYKDIVYYGIADESENVCLMEITKEEFDVLREYVKEIKNEEDK